MGIEAGVEDVIRLKSEEDGEKLRRLVDPKMPSAEEMEKHTLSGHIPYRS